MQQLSLESLKLRMLARRIRDNVQLAKLVQAANPQMREAVYSKIKPHLKFKALDFEQLMLVNPNGKVVRVG